MLYLCDRMHQTVHPIFPALYRQMPLIENFPLTVRTFLGLAKRGVFWTERRSLEAIDTFAAITAPIWVSRAFADPENAFVHGAGTVFDLCRGVSARQRQELRFKAIESGLFYRVATELETPDCVRVFTLPMRTLRLFDAGADVLHLQALLIGRGAHGIALSGTYCEQTALAVRRIQLSRGLSPTGEADAALQRALAKRGV